MDLEPIEERAEEFFTWVGRFDSGKRVDAAFASAADVPALIDEVKRLRLAEHPDNEECASCTHAYVRDLEEDNWTMTEELLSLRTELAHLRRVAALADAQERVRRSGADGGFVKESSDD